MQFGVLVAVILLFCRCSAIYLEDHFRWTIKFASCISAYL